MSNNEKCQFCEKGSSLSISYKLGKGVATQIVFFCQKCKPIALKYVNDISDTHNKKVIESWRNTILLEINKNKLDSTKNGVLDLDIFINRITDFALALKCSSNSEDVKIHKKKFLFGDN